MRRGSKPAKAKVEAKPPAHKSRKNEASRVRDLEQRLAEALKREAEAREQQTATSEILRVISQSPTDVQPVFDTIVRNGMRLTGAARCVLFGFDGEMLSVLAMHNVRPEGIDLIHRIFPSPASRQSAMGRAVLDRTIAHIPDVTLDPQFGFQEAARAVDFRAVLAVPMIRESVAIGAIVAQRSEPGVFSESQVQLLQTFADQAVIAIENVRLFNETKEALEQQTATSEILGVISRSPTDVQPVLDAVVESAVRLCDAYDARIWRLEGDRMVRAAGSGPLMREDVRTWLPLDAGVPSTQAFLERRTVQTDDVMASGIASIADLARRLGIRAVLATPLMREGQPIGVLSVRRREGGPFSNKQVDLLRTFADQAVIAIENVRLFTELQASNRELTTALDTQTASSDILRVISRSQTDVQPVFDAIVSSAVRLLRGYSGALIRVAGDRLELAALTSTVDVGVAAQRARFPQPLQSPGPHAETIRARAPINVVDAQTDPGWESEHAYARARGYRSLVAVPLLRHRQAIGAIAVTRRELGGFTDDEIALLETFADQAVIAIENVRLFKELEARNRDLTEALEQQTATSEVLRAISGSTFDLAPVLQTLVENATRLCNARHGYIFKFDGESLHPAADYGASPEFTDYWRQNPIRPGPNSTSGRAALERRTVHIHDVTAEPSYQYLGVQSQEGFRTVLAVPMLREATLLGVITLWKTRVEPFSNRQIELVTTFADQAVIAIENVRLFTELQARTGQLMRSVEELRALSEVGRAVSSTLDLETVLTTIVDRAVELSAADSGSILEYDETAEQFYLRVSNEDEEVVVALRGTPLRKGEGATGKMAVTREPVQIPDIVVQGAYESRVREALLRSGRRAVLAVPLLSEEHIIGGLVITRDAAGEFPDEVVELLKTFATQSALAIQNARLFREIEQKSRELEAASRHKSEFLANMSHELRTPLNAIIGFSEVLSERMFGDLNEKQEEYLKDIYASGTHLLSLINDILDLSKIEAGRMELELTDFHLPQAIDNALTLVRERAGRRRITLEHAMDERLGEIRGDERKVKQVLLNLLSNALKFTPEGGRVDVRAGIVDGMAEIAVTDTGVGIAPEDQGAIFEEFRQVGTAEKKAEGTGLGLTLCRKFVELHGGKIWVKSQVGVGSTFTFTIPVRRDG